MKKSHTILKAILLFILITGILNINDYYYATQKADAANSNLIVSAEINPSSIIAISANNVALNITPSVEGTFSSAYTTVTAFSNSTNTCTVTMTTSSTDLTSGADTIPTLSTTASEANFENDKWGFRIGSSGDYNPVALSNTIATYSQATGSVGINSNIYFASKLTPATKPGTYTNTVTFISTCTPPPITYIQDLTLSECQSEATNNSFTVYDRRDGNNYTVRYIEGACWMTQNLRIAGTVTATDSNFSGPSVNVSEYSLDANDSSYIGHCDTNNSYNYPCSKYSGNTTTGAWYNYASATAMTITGNPNAQTATSDICPAGWHLPTYDTNNSAGSVNSMSSTSTTSVTKFSPVIGGRYGSGNDGILGLTENGYWWSDTASSDINRYRLRYDGTDLITNDNVGNRIIGYFIRCVRTQ